MIVSPVVRASLLKTLLPVLFIGLTACSDDSQLVDNPTQAVQASNSTASTRLATPTANTGTVKTIQNSGGYTYLEIDIDGKVFWMASPLSSVQPGEKVTWSDYAMMKNFTSKAIDRTFDQIMFVDKVFSTSAMATSGHSGSVLEITSAGGYSYIQVEEQGKKIWLAAPVAEIEVGQNISWNSGAAMRNFTSKSLNRSFDEIFFVSAVKVNPS
ncbi:MAG: SH3-like domain-containing protein [Proteobacteria bacterium]|nr:SH3-like domain-containing protein [Pseudomonadota bacterium]